MNDKSLSHDATSSTKAIVYQLYVTVLKCYEMMVGQKVLVEKLGDVTIVGEKQIEVKAHSQPLTDEHPNFWKTLYNWMSDEFDHTEYSSLILFTTQEFGSRSQLRVWNKSPMKERLEILKRIKQNRAKRPRAKRTSRKGSLPVQKTDKYMGFILGEARAEKLEHVLGKLFIEAQEPPLQKLHEQIKQQYIKGILEGKKDSFLEALVGFITQPRAKASEQWEITFEAFDEKVGELITTYCRDTIAFPRKYLDPRNEIDERELARVKRHVFVEKIRDIEYGEVIREAIRDYLSAIRTVGEEFRTHTVPESRTENFIYDLTRSFTVRYRLAERNCRDIIPDSQNFYDEICKQDSPTFEGFQNTPAAFRNGLLHAEMDEKEDLIWRLE